MASELLKTKALSARIKEPKVRDFDFGLNLTSIESLIPDLPEPKPPELLDLQEQNRKQRLLQSLQRIGGGLEDSSLDFIRRQNFSNGLGANISKYKSKGKQLGYNVRSRKEGIEKTFSKYQYDGSLEKALEAAKKYREEILGNYITNEQYLELRNQHKEKSAKEFAEYIKKETNFKPRRGEKFTREGVKTRDREVNFETTRVKTKRTLALEIEEEVYQKYLKAVKEGKREGTIIGLGREYLPGLTRSQQEKTISRILKEKGVDLSPFKKEGTGEKAATQVARRERLSTAKKQAGSSAGQLSDEIILDIKAMNDKVKNMSLEDIAANKKYINSMRINATMDNLSKGVIPFDKYKDLTDLELAEKIKDRADANKFFDVEHISSVKGQKRNLYYPNNIQMAPGQFGSLMDNFKRIADEQPNNPVLLKVDEVLSDYNLTVRNPETKVRLGNKSVIEVTDGTSNIVKSNFEALNIPFEKQTITKAAEPRKNIKKIIASIACPFGKADGGRIGFQDGTSCFEKGKKMINTGNIPEGAAKRNFAKFANKAMEIGKQGGRGLRTIAKFGVLPEMVIIGADTLIRAGMGDTFNEAFLRASDIYRTDDAYEQADASEINRRMNSNDGELILNLRKFNNERAKLSSLEQQKEADLTLAGDDFAETNSGMTENEIEKFYAPRIQEQENNLFNASISDAEERAGLAKETEFADKKGVDYKKSIVGGFLDTLAEKPGLKQAVDLFNTGTVQQPDVSAQAIDNYAPGAFKKTLKKYGPKVTLDAIKRFEAEQEYPEGAVRNKNLQDEERRLLFEAAKNDPALAELYFGPSMMFAGDPIDSTDLQDEMNLDRGIYSQGGRIGFKEGPKNPGRRTFMKLAAGIASIPILGKFFKPAVPLVKKLANSSTVMPDWFPNFVDKFIGRSIGKKIDADFMEYTNPDLPNIKLSKSDDGKILVEGRNEFNEAYNINYEPPGYEVLDYKTGKSVKTPGNFEAVEGRHVALGPEDFDTDAFYADDLDELYTVDVAEMEKYTTGNVTGTAKDSFGRDTGLKQGMYDSDMAQGKAENEFDILRDEGLDEID